jgi:hypothetical protein
MYISRLKHFLVITYTFEAAEEALLVGSVDDSWLVGFSKPSRAHLALLIIVLATESLLWDKPCLGCGIVIPTNRTSLFYKNYWGNRVKRLPIIFEQGNRTWKSTWGWISVAKKYFFEIEWTASFCLFFYASMIIKERKNRTKGRHFIKVKVI